jgi:2-methylcitrate dehydratase PrpD
VPGVAATLDVAAVLTPVASPSQPVADAALRAARTAAGEALRVEVETVARQCVVDWLAVALAGSREPVARGVRAAVLPPTFTGTAPLASVIGAGRGAAAIDAALCNGVAGHALDYDDTLAGPFHGHATAPILPAALALAEQREASFGGLLAALVSGVAAASAVGRAMNPASYDAGWHSSAVLGTLGAALACTELLGLGERQRQHALGLAAVQAAGLRGAFGTMAKPFQVGRAACSGLLAALLAERGVDAPADAVDGEHGLLATHSACAGRWDGPPDELAILATLFKRHASCHGTHAPIEAITRLREEHRVEPDAVRAVELDVTPGLLGVCNADAPATGLEAKFSLSTVAAMALRGDDTGDPGSFTDARANDSELRELARRVTVRGDTALGEWEARATLELADDTSVQCAVDLTGRLPDRELDWHALVIKAARLATPVIGARRATELPGLVGGLDRRAPVRELTAAARPAG